MAAKKKRMVWRISDIVAAAEPRDRCIREDVASMCRSMGGDVPLILRMLNLTIPRAIHVDTSVWNAMTDERRAAALVATAKRLGVKQVPA